MRSDVPAQNPNLFQSQAGTYVPVVTYYMTSQAPQYELHVPSYMAQAMSSAPPLSLLATAAWIETDNSYDDICDIIEIRASLSYDAFFVSEKPPLNPVRADAAPGVQEFEADIQEHMTGDDTH